MARPDAIPRQTLQRGSVAAGLVLAASCAWGMPLAPGPCDLAVEVTPRHDSTPRVLEVRLEFPAEGRNETFLRMESGWAGIADFGAALHGWRGATAAISIAPADGVQRWRIGHPGQDRVAVHYRVRASLGQPDENRPQPQEQLYRPQIGGDWFQFFGHAVLPALEPWGDDRPARVCITLHQPGRPEAPAFGTHHDSRGESVSAAFDGTPLQLRDAFYAGGGAWRLNRRAVTGATLRTAVRGRFAMSDAEFANAAATLIDAHRRFWDGQAPDAAAVPPWLVLTPNFAPGNAGGTLVRQAAVMHAGPAFSPAEASFEFLVGHEHLHQWLPGRFGAVLPDPLREVRGYWFSEGFTNYYTHRLLLAAGLWSLDRYAEEVTDTLRSYWRSPARNAAVDDIAPRFFSDHDAGRQLYSRGEMLAMRWDRALRERGHPGLDAVLRGLLLPAGVPVPATPLATDRVLDAMEALLGPLPRRDVAAHVDRGRTLQPDEGLAGPCLAVRWDEVPLWTLGFDPASFKSRVASGVDPDGPAHAAGLREGMALRGWSVHGGDVTREVELSVGDDAAPRRLRYRPIDGRTVSLPTAVVRPGASGHAACQAWQRVAPRAESRP